MNWHNREIEEVIQILQTSRAGLTDEEATKRLAKYGPNELREGKEKTPLMIFLDQFRDFMILVLLAAAVISGIIGEPSDTVAIMVIVLLNAAIGFVQEFRAEQAIAALRKMAAPEAVVLRNGTPSNVAVSRLVRGDIVLLESGNFVPADLRLLEVSLLKVAEAALTGESMPVEKNVIVLKEALIPPGDRSNMAYRGTVVSYGRGTGVVVATGMETEIGRIAEMLQAQEEVKTPLQKRLAAFGQKLAVAVLAICAIIFGIGVLRGEPALLMLLTAVSLAVAAIPEALPAVVTISLALGAKKMVRQNALIRRLPAVETLGSVTYICSDKTGTLTLNKMTAEDIYIDGKISRAELTDGAGAEIIRKFSPGLLNSPASALFIALALSNDAREDSSGGVTGDPTEVALYNLARDKGFVKKVLEERLPRLAEIPFDSERKCMTTVHEIPNGPPSVRIDVPRFISFTKGAIDFLVEKSSHVLTSDGLKKIDAAEIRKVNEMMSQRGLRVLGISMRTWDTRPDDALDIEADLTILGMVGMLDPPREEAEKAVRTCRAAGIRPVMITGDHPLTAKAIAGRLGILEKDSKAVITGGELEELPLEEFEQRVRHIRVYARVAPQQKLKIVRALQDKGEFVAMTGDGVNDAPAIKRADIGIAMGVTGTDAAKEASDMILLDDNFATIVNAAKEGRNIYDNIRKFIKYLLTTNSGEIWTLFLAPFMGLPVPLLPIQILWINLVTDGLPALALSVEPPERDVMSRPPRHPKESIFAHGLGNHAIWVGILMAGIVLFVQAWSLRTGHEHWQTMVFTALCLTQLGHVLAIRSEKESLFTIGLFSNKPLLAAVVLSFVLQMAVIYAPFLNPLFKTEPLSLPELGVTLVLSSVVFFAVEAEKLAKRKMGI